MKHVRVLGFCALSLLLALASPAWAQRELKLGTGAGTLGAEISLPLTLTTDGNVQGFVAAFDWDGTKLEGMDLATAAGIVAADVIVPRIESAFAVLGVVMDSDGTGGEIIPAGETLLATLKVKALGPSGSADEVVPVTFKDGTYATVDLGPALDNIIVIGGQSIGKAEGLELADGQVTLRQPPPGTFTIKSKTGEFGDEVSIPIEMAASVAVQGFVTAVKHAAGITLSRVELGAAAAGADFKQEEIFATGGTFGVVMELDGVAPFLEIPAGGASVIANYVYTSAAKPCVDPADIPANTVVYALEFADGMFGDPLKENVIVIAGRSKNPELVNGTLTLKPCITQPPSEMTFAVGACELDADGVPAQIVAHPGEKIQVGLW